MFLYASIWDASYIAKGSWTGTYVGCDAPYHCLYKEIHVPAGTVKLVGELGALGLLSFVVCGLETLVNVDEMTQMRP
ncbi:hypothetical protein G4B88_019583, partial [Cannabis sativa]